MKYTKYITSFSLCLSQFFSFQFVESSNYQLVVQLPQEDVVLEINPNDSFADVMLQAKDLIENDQFSIDFEEESHEKFIFLDCRSEMQKILNAGNSSASIRRHYETKLTSKEKKDIAYIVTTLGRSSLKKLLTAKSAIKEAGNRVDHVHPLRFIACIFGDEELKVGILQIKERGGFVAREFFSGIYEGLTEESGLQNLKEEYIVDFANQLQIDPSTISKSIEKGNWKEFINILIDLLPRTGNPNRYDM